jgi:hypothetical protein
MEPGLISSYYDINDVRPVGTYFEYPKPYYKTSPTKDLRTGFYAGVFLEIRLKKRLSLEPGLAYVQKGIDLDFSTTTGTASSQTAYRFARSIHTNYVAIPVVVKYYLGHKQRFYVAGGIYDAFAVKSKIKEASTSSASIFASGGLPAYSTSYSTLSEIKTRVIDCGLVGGVGFNLPVGTRFSVGIDARVNVGLIDVQGNSSASNYLNFNSSTKNINLETGLRAAYALSAQ